jgi:hypothetical protein
MFQRSLALMMEAARTSEMLVNFYQTTWHYNPEDSHLNIKMDLKEICGGVWTGYIWLRNDMGQCGLESYG